MPEPWSSAAAGRRTLLATAAELEASAASKAAEAARVEREVAEAQEAVDVASATETAEVEAAQRKAEAAAAETAAAALLERGSAKRKRGRPKKKEDHGVGARVKSPSTPQGSGSPGRPVSPIAESPLDDELAALKAESERRLGEWVESGESLVSSSLYDAVAFCSTGLGDEHSHDAQIALWTTGKTA